MIPSLNGLENRLIAAETRLVDTVKRPALGELSFDIARLQEENQTQRTDFAERAQALQRRIVALESRKMPEPQNQLGLWIQRNGIFFGDGTTYRNSPRAQRTLSQLADLMRNDSAKIRVIGYADARGRPDANRTLAQDRAERVVTDLTRAGVPALRLIAVGRASERQFSTQTGPESGNRRVEFELLFDGE